MNVHESEYFLKHLRREYEALSKQLARVRRSLRRALLGEDKESARKTTIVRLGELRNRLLSHFEEEEFEGCLEEAVSRRPSLAREAMEIVAEHRVLIRDLDRVVALLSRGATPNDVADVEVEFETFAQRLIDHEKREQLAVEAGLNVAE